jgi:hypothetical protein
VDPVARLEKMKQVRESKQVAESTPPDSARRAAPEDPFRLNEFEKSFPMLEMIDLKLFDLRFSLSPPLIRLRISGRLSSRPPPNSSWPELLE